ncbi:MAG: tripartite tricarboxylate transporter permease [DPANN group archaeon]|nr:tripartite tricarboxylate transporter permease [DPANN group archaeon]
MSDLIIYIIYCIIGCLTGCITGLIPGIHTNTIASILLGLYYTNNFNPLTTSAFIVGAAVSHTFLDFIPAIFLGAPDSNTALIVLPTHRMLLKGRGYEAILLSVTGGLMGILILTLSAYILFTYIPQIYIAIRPYIHLILILIMIIIIHISTNRKATLFIFILSGILGLVSLNTNLINKNFVLLPMFSGLFGLSNLILSFNETSNIPKQTTKTSIILKDNIYGATIGVFGGTISGLLPGLGTSQCSMILKELGFIKKTKIFITVLGCIGTIDIILSFISIYLIGNARSGSAIIIENIMNTLTFDTLVLFCGLALISAGLSAIITMYIGQHAAKLVENINYQKMTASVIILIILITILFSRLYGLILLISSTALGIATKKMKVKVSILMGCLIIPTILYFSGYLYIILKIF